MMFPCFLHFPACLGHVEESSKEPEIAHNLSSYLMFFIGQHYIASPLSLIKITNEIGTLIFWSFGSEICYFDSAEL